MPNPDTIKIRELSRELNFYWKSEILFFDRKSFLVQTSNSRKDSVSARWDHISSKWVDITRGMSRRSVINLLKKKYSNKT